MSNGFYDGFPYDKADPQSIEAYGKKMIGHTFYEIYQSGKDNGITHEEGMSEDYAVSHAKKDYKGGMGNLVEECHFGYRANNEAEPDFPEAGVELKTTPYKKTRKGYAAKERLVLTMIDYFRDAEMTDLKHSHLWRKAGLILLVWYLHQKGVNDIYSTVDYVQLFSPPAEDMAIIEADYEKIIRKIRDGKAHELSEGDTMYLGACTKASDSSVRRAQPYSDESAKPRAFSLKNSYMTYVLTHYILPGKKTYEPILKDAQAGKDFERLVISKLDQYRGMRVDEICSRFGIDKKQCTAKHLGAMLAFRILGVIGNQAEEFEKAGIVVKTIRIRANGTIKENMSFPAFKFAELAEEEWEDSTFGNYLRETRFFFVVYRMDSTGSYRLQGGQFWNMPYDDLEHDVREVWEKTRDIIREGRLEIRISKDGSVQNNFPKQSENRVAHVRPHARNRDDVYPLPEGTRLHAISEGTIHWKDDTCYTKQCFWLNNGYILSQLNR